MFKRSSNNIKAEKFVKKSPLEYTTQASYNPSKKLPVDFPKLGKDSL
jgi:hypothetical protein